MFPLQHHHRRVWLASLIAGLLALVVLGCTAVNRPTVPPQPTMDLIGTVTAQAAPMVATQTAISAALTQVVAAQATGTAQSQAQQAATGQVATTQAATSLQSSGAATQTALVQGAAAQAATGTALAQVAAAQAVTATSLAQAAATQAQTVTVVGVAVGTPTAPAPARTATATVGTPLACVPVDPALKSIFDKAQAAGLDGDCPVGPAKAINGALQEYWTNADPNKRNRSLMIWREDEQAIYVINGKDAQTSQGLLLAYQDTFVEGDPEVPPVCAGMNPPKGYQTPVRGFGRVWCANKLAPVVGWPNRNETAAKLLVQPLRYGLLLRAAPDVGSTYLVMLDFRSSTAVTNQVNP